MSPKSLLFGGCSPNFSDKRCSSDQTPMMDKNTHHSLPLFPTSQESSHAPSQSESSQQNTVMGTDARSCGCGGNPTSADCPVNRAYALLDPGVSDYTSLDCSVVVYEVKKSLDGVTDPDIMSRVSEELAECPACSDLIDMEDRLRETLHRALSPQAPPGLMERLLRQLRALEEEREDSPEVATDATTPE